MALTETARRGGAHVEGDPFDVGDADLRRAGSVKWTYGADGELPAWVAEMDARPSRAIQDAVREAVERRPGGGRAGGVRPPPPPPPAPPASRRLWPPSPGTATAGPSTRTSWCPAG